jgi:hypothetical protein
MLPRVDQIPAELIQVGDEILQSQKYEPVELIWNKEELPHQLKESIAVFFLKR